MKKDFLKLCLVTGLALPLLSCSSEQKRIETVVVNIADATCKFLDGQSEPGWVRLVCSAIETAAEPAKTFILRMPADKFSAATCAPALAAASASAPAKK